MVRMVHKQQQLEGWNPLYFRVVRLNSGGVSPRPRPSRVAA